MEQSRLTLEEREEIALGLCRGESLRRVAGRLARSPATVWREVRAGGGASRYRAVRAAEMAKLRKKRPKLRKLTEGTPLWNRVCADMQRGWSPQQVAARMKVDYPDDEAMRVSHETIYTWFYLLPQGELKAAMFNGTQRYETGETNPRTRAAGSLRPCSCRRHGEH